MEMAKAHNNTEEVKCCFQGGSAVDAVDIAPLINGLVRMIMYTGEAGAAPRQVVAQYEGQFYDQAGSGFGRLIYDDSRESGNSML